MKLRCQKCGSEVERKLNVPATCFDCYSLIKRLRAYERKLSTPFLGKSVRPKKYDV
jgi:hypothetical protein